MFKIKKARKNTIKSLFKEQKYIRERLDQKISQVSSDGRNYLFFKVWKLCLLE